MPPKDPITTSVSHADGVAVLAVSGEIDLATIPAFEAAIADALKQRPTALIVDVSAVDFLASAGLQALVATHESVRGEAGFAVVADGPATSRPIELTGLDQILSLHASVDDAKAAVTGSGPQN
ncbi:STAS domain-containing protein [Mycobacterium barrassiae]|uniref:STAS domain-containing protein n=1 Tax=Mycobacterium barrassiae TaxID=319709 RepID=UPI002265D9C1|nr:STAS domain-containing protein [Mycobacterium barrassiae]MCV7302073.1 STAS domain-containing protein [Mycobacterium barrassiae]